VLKRIEMEAALLSRPALVDEELYLATSRRLYCITTK